MGTNSWRQAKLEEALPMPEKPIRDTSLDAIFDGWKIIEDALREAGMTGPPHSTIPFRDRAEELSRALVARLSQHEPPILFAFAHEIATGELEQ